jgi:hypothetical protein
VVAPVLSMDQLYNLMDREELPGTRDELEVLQIWIDELAQNKGEEWVRRHRVMLRDQWRYFVKHGIDKLGKPPIE